MPLPRLQRSALSSALYSRSRPSQVAYSHSHSGPSSLSFQAFLFPSCFFSAKNLTPPLDPTKIHSLLSHTHTHNPTDVEIGFSFSPPPTTECHCCAAAGCLTTAGNTIIDRPFCLRFFRGDFASSMHMSPSKFLGAAATRSTSSRLPPGRH